MKKKPSKSKKSHAKKTNKEGDGPRFTWVDRVLDGWVDREDDDEDENEDSAEEEVFSESLSVSIVSWNVLADSYCSRRSHRQLPMVYQKHVFDRHQRQHHVRQILRRM